MGPLLTLGGTTQYWKLCGRTKRSQVSFAEEVMGRKEQKVYFSDDVRVRER